MGEVIDIRANQPHLSGRAVCLECKHDWVAVAPLGTHSLECPACGLAKGTWFSTILPDEVWTCHCGNAAFVVTREYFMCTYCGQYQEFGDNG